MQTFLSHNKFYIYTFVIILASIVGISTFAVPAQPPTPIYSGEHNPSDQFDHQTKAGFLGIKVSNVASSDIIFDVLGGTKIQKNSNTNQSGGDIIVTGYPITINGLTRVAALLGGGGDFLFDIANGNLIVTDSSSNSNITVQGLENTNPNQPDISALCATSAGVLIRCGTTPPIISTVQLVASPTTLTAGGTTTLTWQSENTTGCTATASITTAGWTGSKAINGSDEIVVNQDTNFLINCTKMEGGGNVTANVLVTASPITVEPVYAWNTGNWSTCSNGNFNRNVSCGQVGGGTVASSLCGASTPPSTLSLPTSCTQDSQCTVTLPGSGGGQQYGMCKTTTTTTNVGSCTGPIQACLDAGAQQSALACNAVVGGSGGSGGFNNPCTWDVQQVSNTTGVCSCVDGSCAGDGGGNGPVVGSYDSNNSTVSGSGPYEGLNCSQVPNGVCFNPQPNNWIIHQCHWEDN